MSSMAQPFGVFMNISECTQMIGRTFKLLLIRITVRVSRELAFLNNSSQAGSMLLCSNDFM